MQEDRHLAERVASEARRRGLLVGVAESLTGGLLASRLAAAPAAADWFRGAIVAYSGHVKRALLGVPPGPVVSRPAVVAMARGVAQLLGTQVSVAVTGVGGPEPQDGQSPGTVWIGVCDGALVRAALHHFAEPDPDSVCRRTCTEALRALVGALPGGDRGAGTPI